MPASQPAPRGAPTCAVLVDPGMVLNRSPIVALLEAKLAEGGRVRLVERQEINRILAEQKLQLLFEADAGAKRSALGALLKADLLVLLQASEPKPDQPAITALVCETAAGLRLNRGTVFWTTDAATCAGLDATVERALRKYAEGIREICAVPPFVTRDFTHEHDDLQRVYARLIEQVLMNRSGFAVVELAEARAIASELRLSGDRAIARKSPLYFVGEYETASKPSASGVSIKVELKRGDVSVASAEARALALEAAGPFLTRAVEELLAKAQITGQAAPGSEADAGELAKRAEALAGIGSWPEAMDLVQAALLLKADDPQTHLLASRIAAELVRINSESSEGGDKVAKARAAMANYRVAQEHWEKLLDLIDLRKTRLGNDFRLPENGAAAAVAWAGRPPELQAELEAMFRERSEICIRILERKAGLGQLTQNGWWDVLAYPAFRLGPVPGAPPLESRLRLLRTLVQTRETDPYYIYDCVIRSFPLQERNSEPYLSVVRELQANSDPRVRRAVSMLLAKYPPPASSPHNPGPQPTRGADEVVFEPLDLVIRDERGREYRTRPGMPRRMPQLVAWQSMDEGLEVAWLGRDVARMTTPGFLDTLSCFQPGDVRSEWLCSDGQNVWIAVQTKAEWELAILDVRSGQVHRFTAAEGVPPMDRARAVAITRGQILCAACVIPGMSAMAAPDRAWCGVLTMGSDGRLTVDLLLQARKQMGLATMPSEKDESEPDAVFLPRRVVAIPACGSSFGWRALVTRGDAKPNSHRVLASLLITPQTRQIDVLPTRWDNPWPTPDAADGCRWFWLDTARHSAREPMIGMMYDLKTLMLPDLAPHTLIRRLPEEGSVIVDGDTLHVVGEHWFRIRPGATTPECLAMSNLRRGWPRVYISSHYGLIALSCNDKNPGMLHRVRFVKAGDSRPAPIPPPGTLVAAPPARESRAALRPQPPTISPAIEPMLADVPEGVLIARCLNDEPDTEMPGTAPTQARRLGLAPGDVIVQVNDQPVRSTEEFARITATPSQKTRTLVVVGAKGRRTVTAQPGKLGIVTCDCKPPWGPPLARAVQACARREYARAHELFNEARAAGLVLKGTEITPLLYAVSKYYAGDTAGATAILESAVREVKSEYPWTNLRSTYKDCFELLISTPYSNLDNYLSLYFREKGLQYESAHLRARVEAYWFLTQQIRAYPRALAAWWALLRNSGEQASDTATAHIIRILRYLGMHTEGAAFCEWAASRSNELTRVEGFDAGALELGAHDLLTRVYERDYASAQHSHVAAYDAQKLISLYVAAGQIEDARKLIRGFSTAASPLSNDGVSSAVLVGWSQLAPVWAEHARKALADHPNDAQMLAGAFAVLSHQPQPEPDELNQIVQAWAGLSKDSSVTSARLDVARFRGNDEKIDAILRDRWGYDEPKPLEAISFIRRFGPTLTGARSLWQDTWWAFRNPAGGWLLLTRDMHIGLTNADASEISELPLPEPAWAPRALTNTVRMHFAPSESFAFSPSGRTVVAMSAPGTLFVLNNDRKAWSRLAVFPPYVIDKYMPCIQPILDTFAEILLARDASVHRIAWPPDTEWAPGCPGAGGTKLMLADGTWLVIDGKTGKLLLPREAAVKALGEPVDIYEMSDLNSGRAVYLYTSRGVLEWQREAGSVKALAFPDRPEPAPALCLTDGLERRPGHLRVALLPEAGGAVYSLDVKTGTLSREPGRNESWPMTYWLQRSPEVNRREVAGALKKAGLVWPSEWMRPADKPER